MTTPPRLLADRMPCASTPSRRYRCAASSLTARSLRARVRHEARGFSVRKPSDEVLRQHLSTSVRLHLKFAAELFKEWGPPLSRSVSLRCPAASRRTSTHRADNGILCSRPISFVRRERSKRQRPDSLRPMSQSALRRTSPPSAPGTRMRAWCQPRRCWPVRRRTRLQRYLNINYLRTKLRFRLYGFLCVMINIDAIADHQRSTDPGPE